MIIEKQEIVKKISILEKAIPSKATIESLCGILVKNGTMTASDLNITIQVPVEIGTDEAFIIPKSALAVIKKIPDGELKITAEPGNGILIRTKSIRNKFKSFPVDDYPAVETLTSTNSLALEIPGLQGIIGNMLYAVPATSQRPAMTGMLFEADGTNLNIVACDGFRCAWTALPYSDSFKLIIPRAVLQTLLYIGISDSVAIRYNRKTAVFQMENCTVYAKLLDGEFLNYKAIFPNRDKTIDIDRGQLLGCVERIGLCADDKARPKVAVDGEGNKIKLSLIDGTCEYQEELTLENSLPGILQVAFNGRYMLECLKSYDADTLACSFGTAREPLMTDDGRTKSLVLPVAVSSRK